MTDTAVMAKEYLAETQIKYLTSLLDNRQTISGEVKKLEAEKKKIDEEIKELMAEANHANIQTEKWSVKLIASVRRSLDERLLLKNGVAADIIAMSKKETQVVSLRVDEVKQNDEK